MISFFILLWSYRIFCGWLRLILKLGNLSRSWQSPCVEPPSNLDVGAHLLVPKSIPLKLSQEKFPKLYQPIITWKFMQTFQMDFHRIIQILSNKTANIHLYIKVCTADIEWHFQTVPSFPRRISCLNIITCRSVQYSGIFCSGVFGDNIINVHSIQISINYLKC